MLNKYDRETYIELISNLSSGALIIIDGLISFANASAYNILGKKLSTYIDEKFEDMIRYDIEALKPNFIFNVEDLEGEVHLLCVQGISSLSSNGSEIILLIFDNIRANIYESSLESIGDAVVITDEYGYIRFCNKYSENLFNINFSNSYGQNVNDKIKIVCRDSQEIQKIDISKILNSNYPIGTIANSYVTTLDGSEKYISMTATKIINNNVVIGAVLLFRNISTLKRSEEKLRKYSMAIKENPNIVIITDSIFRIEYANSKFRDMIETSINDTVDTSLTKYFPEFFNSSNLEKLTNLGKDNKKLSSEIKLSKKFGLNKWLIISVSGIFNIYGEIENYIFVAQDISKLKRKDEVINKERKNLEMIFRGAPLGMIIVNSYRKILKVNEEASKIFRRSIVDILGSRIGSVTGCVNEFNEKSICGETNNCNYCFLRNTVDKVIENERSVLNEEYMHTIIEESGYKSEMWLKISAVPINMNSEINALIVIEDITKTKDLRKVIVENEKKLRIITDNMMDMITQIDSNGQVLYASPSHYEILGYKNKDLIGRKFSDFIHKDDVKKTYMLFEKRLVTHENFTTELRLMKSDGSFIWVESSGNIVNDDNSQISIVYLSRDITAKKKAELEILKAKEMAEFANNAKSQFLANMSHEIRTPMNGIIGMTNMTLMTKLDTVQRENLNMVKSSAISLLNLINSILDFSKIEAGKLNIDMLKISVNSLCDKVIKSFEVIARDKNLNIRYDFDDKISNYHMGDPNRIRQVMNNLIGNALKFTDYGDININIELFKSEDGIEWLKFSVKDTGIGIKENDRENIFSMFSQADGTITRKYGGTGLGLSISKQLVELMGGEIGFDSIYKKGSNFYFILPLKTDIDPSLYARAEESITIPEASEKIKILVVEDDKINQMVAEKLLLKQGHDVTIVNNGLEAVDSVSKCKYDLILMDIQMPELDGIEATRIIREDMGYKDIIIIALTAHAITGDREKFLALGMNDYISKPIDVKEFFDVLDINFKKLSKSKDDKLIIDFIDDLSRKNEYKEMKFDYSEILKLNDYIEHIGINLNEENYSLVEKYAHLIKIKSDEIGLKELKRQALKLEIKSRSGDFILCKKLFEELIQLVMLL